MNSKIDFEKLVKIVDVLKSENGMWQFKEMNNCILASRRVLIDIFLSDATSIKVETDGNIIFDAYLECERDGIMVSRRLKEDEMEKVLEFLKEKKLLNVPKGVFKVIY